MKLNFLSLAVVLWSIALVSLSSNAQVPALTGKLIKPVPDSSAKPQSAGSNVPIKTSSDLGDTLEKIPVLPSRHDDIRTQTILNSMIKQAGWFPEIKIAVVEGMVTIKGRAKNSEQLQWLAKTADRLPSVVAVINQAEIETPPVTDLTPAWTEFKRIIESAKKALPLFLLALIMTGIFLVIGRYLHKMIYSLWQKQISNPFLLSTVSKLTMLPIWLVFFYLTLRTAGLSTLATTIIGGTGAAGIVLGFAFKDIAENYLSGLLLAIRSPFTKGDEIQVAQFEGYVQSLNMRGTTIIDYDGNLVLIPNSIVIQSVIRNKTTSPNTRSFFMVSIGYKDSVTKAQELIYQVLKGIPAILNDPPPLVIVEQLQAGGMNLRVMFWYNCVTSSLYKTKSTAITRTKEILLANNFSLPDGTQGLIFNDTLNVHVLQTAEEVKLNEKERLAATQENASINLTESKTSGDDNSRQGHERDVQRVAGDAQIMKKSADHELLEN